MKTFKGTDSMEENKEEELPPLPPISTKAVKGISDVLTSLNTENGDSLVSKEESKNLASLRFKNGEIILSLEERWFVYEIIWLLSEKGYEQTYNFLSNDWEKALGSMNIRKKMLFENPLMDPQKEKFAVDMEIYRNKTEVVVGGESCRRCKSGSTISVEKQMKSCDELVSIKVTCLACGYKWSAQ